MKQSDVSFLMMKSWGEQLKMLTIEQRGILLTAIYDFQCNGVEFETDDATLELFWLFIRQIFIYNNKKYEEKCEQNRRNALKRVEKYERLLPRE